jgi:hypothetical protein
MLSIDDNESSFDGEIIPHINATFSTLYQIGVGTAVPISDTDSKWSDLLLPDEQLNLVKTLMQMKVKLAFDPPGTSYLLDTVKELVREQEYRIQTFVECKKTWPPEEVVTP